MIPWLTLSVLYGFSFVLFYRWVKKYTRKEYQRGKDVGYNLGYQEGQLKLLKALAGGKKISDIEFLRSIGITL